MMLVRSLPTSIDDHGKQESSCVWLPGDESWQEPTKPFPVTKHNSKDNVLWSHSSLCSSQLSTEINMSETPTLNYVYKRRMTLRNVLPPNPSSSPTLVYKRRKVQRDDSKSGSVDGEFIEDQKCKTKKRSGLNINDSCSSSKSNIDLGSAFLKQQVDDAGECSSSSVVIVEGTNSCISFPKQHGLLERHTSSKKACKVCGQLTKTLKMLICDLCEESFHMTCCNPAVKKVPVGDWFCNSCSRKKLKKMETNSSKLPEICLGPVASTLSDSDPFTSNVRIGEDFQAEIPDWSGPLTDELSRYLEPMEVSPLECASYQEWDVRKLSTLGSIGNWLQCREVVDGVDGSVCGKWRRAPLFEVQTDKWECFSSVLWDPTHADCAVPQELDTEQVLKQLKYIEMLMPRLSAKRWKLGVTKRVDHPKNTQKSFSDADIAAVRASGLLPVSAEIRPFDPRLRSISHPTPGSASSWPLLASGSLILSLLWLPSFFEANGLSYAQTLPMVWHILVPSLLEIGPEEEETETNLEKFLGIPESELAFRSDEVSAASYHTPSMSSSAAPKFDLDDMDAALSSGPGTEDDLLVLGSVKTEPTPSPRSRHPRPPVPKGRLEGQVPLLLPLSLPPVRSQNSRLWRATSYLLDLLATVEKRAVDAEVSAKVKISQANKEATKAKLFHDKSVKLIAENEKKAVQVKADNQAALVKTVETTRASTLIFLPQARLKMVKEARDMKF
ncbi:hypothetical protein SSX86_006426 [Deinandra increscens subsp. villosa]|uniref:Uncharacterized protein n=1 Tax=Deinandra increscens subsp. villosa TaxID=3103831 RepID=A0AAP0DJH5_9ASTR